jgi:hypothetical protein
MEFDNLSIAVREICNGAMAVSAVILIASLARYIAYYAPRAKKRWYDDAGVQIALACIVMLIGNVIRSVGGWAQFVLLRLEHDVDDLVNAMEYFIVATVLVLIGKAMIMFFFMSTSWRLWAVAAMLVVSVLVPFGLFLVL